MEENVKVTVVMPCYNQGKYVNKAVNSVLNQTFQNFEIIIVNDGSTDEETNKILNNFKRPKTKVLHINNQGPSVARNIAIQEARGEYILPLDADDTIEPTYMEKAVKILENNDNVGIVCCNWRTISKLGVFRKITTPKFNYKFPEHLNFRSKSCFPVTSFFRKVDWGKTGGFNKNMLYGMEDYDFWLSIIELDKKIYHIPEVLFNYNRVFKSRDTSMTIEDQKISYFTVFQNHKELYLNNIETILNNSVEISLNNIRIKSLNKRLILLIILTYVFVFLCLVLKGIL